MMKSFTFLEIGQSSGKQVSSKPRYITRNSHNKEKVSGVTNQCDDTNPIPPQSKHISESRSATVQPNPSSEDKALELQNSRLQDKIKKQARTHALLVSIVAVFASSWFPLNLLNVVLDIFSFMEKTPLVSKNY